MIFSPLNVVVRSKRNRAMVPKGFVMVDIDRPTPLGNPFRLPTGYDIEADTANILGRYRDWLNAALAPRNTPEWSAFSAILTRLRNGERIALMCWCFPSRCHGDIVRDMLIVHGNAEVA